LVIVTLPVDALTDIPLPADTPVTPLFVTVTFPRPVDGFSEMPVPAASLCR
jgi:hypothetical protein